MPSAGHQVPQTRHQNGHVQELENPVVNKIHLSNQGERPLFLPEGWIVDGQKQARALSEDILIGANMAVRANVVCVEQGRWSSPHVSSLDHGRAPISVIAAMRSVIDTSTLEGLRLRQTRVWESVQRQESRSVGHPTSSLTQILSSDSRASEVSFLLGELTALSTHTRSATGILVSLSAEPLFLELFQNRELFADNYVSLLQSLPFDVFDSTPSRISRSGVEDFLRAVLRTPLAIQREREDIRILAGRGSGIDVRSTEFLPGTGGLLHSLALNLNHRALQLV